MVYLAALLEGAGDLVTTYNWAYNPAYDWDNLHKAS